jgi:hypothetical protein
MCTFIFLPHFFLFLSHHCNEREENFFLSSLFSFLCCSIMQLALSLCLYFSLFVSRKKKCLCLCEQFILWVWCVTPKEQRRELVGLRVCPRIDGICMITLIYNWRQFIYRYWPISFSLSFPLDYLIHMKWKSNWKCENWELYSIVRDEG